MDIDSMRSPESTGRERHGAHVQERLASFHRRVRVLGPHRCRAGPRTPCSVRIRLPPRPSWVGTRSSGAWQGCSSAWAERRPRSSSHHRPGGIRQDRHRTEVLPRCRITSRWDALRPFIAHQLQEGTDDPEGPATHRPASGSTSSRSRSRWCGDPRKHPKDVANGTHAPDRGAR